MSWSDEDTERVNAAYKEALETMGRYADEEALKPAFIMLDDKIPDPDDVIQDLNSLAQSHLNSMIFLAEAAHTAIDCPNGIEVTLHHAKKSGWIKYTLDIPEETYTPDKIEFAEWLAKNKRNKVLEDRNNGMLSNSSKRKNITWDIVNKAVGIVNTEIIKNKGNYKGQGVTLIFELIAAELSKILQAQGEPAITPSSFNRWLKEDIRKRKDVFDLLSDEAMKIIKNR